MRPFTAAAIGLLLATGALATGALAAGATASAAPATRATDFHAKGMPGATTPAAAPSDSGFKYVYGRQSVAADGASVTLDQQTPKLAAGDYHSLAELAVQSADGKQIVEIGWTVDRGLNGDATPHLFSFHWVDGNGTCYNGCGFVHTGGPTPGDKVTSGQRGSYQIAHRDGQWQLSYNGTEIGYYPDSLWNGGYTKAGLIQAFGEVAWGASPVCTAMGNGTYGHADGSATISDFALVNGAAAAGLSVAATDPSLYDSGAATATSFRFGGPGGC